MKFTESHEWIDVKEEIGTVGITEYAQKELGHVVYVELPRKGAQVSAGDAAAVLESTKAAADVYTPVSGTIIEVNGALAENPELVNQAPEKGGWIFKIHLTHKHELDALMDEEML